MTLDGHVPGGPIESRWDRYKGEMSLINPANRRKYDIIVVGTGLAGASAAATLAEQGYNVKAFTILDSPRRSHSIAAQGGINAAKNYKHDGDSVHRLFYDTIKGGDYRSRESNVHRLAEVSVDIIDQCVAQGVPFAREYGGLLDTRSFGGAQVSRTFYARGQTGQQLLLGAYSALMRQVDAGSVELLTRREMLDLVVVDGKARGIITRNLVSGQLERHAAHAVLLCTGGYANVYFLSTNAGNSNVTATWRCTRRGALFANPSFAQVHPTCIPESGDYQAKLTLMSESLRNDGRVWVPRTAGDTRSPEQIPDSDRDYYLERRYPSFGNLVPRDVASRAAKKACDEGLGVGATGRSVYLDFRDAITRLGKDKVVEKYGNLFDMYSHITGDDPYATPMRIYPAVHYTMGGLWVDYNLMSTIDGLFVLGEANFSDHGANRLGASALMQGLADGYFIAPNTLANYLANTTLPAVATENGAFADAEQDTASRVANILAVDGDKTVLEFHRELGRTMWNEVGMARNREGLTRALAEVQKLRQEYGQNVKVVGRSDDLNKALEFALRVSDYMEYAEVMVRDALQRKESCGCHFREEYQTEDGEALRNDEDYAYVAAWEYKGTDQEPQVHKEQLSFEFAELKQRNYK
ncbi:MAG: fumarate reductase/succinate dehydrogenase flavoprotein subunit [Deltaproteobacteria bacterium]